MKYLVKEIFVYTIYISTLVTIFYYSKPFGFIYSSILPSLMLTWTVSRNINTARDINVYDFKYKCNKFLNYVDFFFRREFKYNILNITYLWIVMVMFFITPLYMIAFSVGNYGSFIIIYLLISFVLTSGGYFLFTYYNFNVTDLYLREGTFYLSLDGCKISKIETSNINYIYTSSGLISEKVIIKTKDKGKFKIYSNNPEDVENQITINNI